MELDRRAFLKGSLVTGGALAAGALVACAPQSETPSHEAHAEESIEADSSWLGVAPDISDSDCVETIDSEVLVIGAGCSGMFAACFAAENGAQTLLIEANELGAGIRSSALAGVNTKQQLEHNIFIDKEDILNDIMHYALNTCDPRLIRSWIDNSAEAIDWYEDILSDTEYTLILEYNTPSEPTRYAYWPTGHGTAPKSDTSQRINDAEEVLPIFIDHFEQAGGEYRNNTKMEKLILEGGKVVGAYASGIDGMIRINASKGVIVCTGGYADNREMYEARQAGLHKSLAGPRSWGSARGEGIKACLWAGADIDHIPTSMIFDRGAIPPDAPLGTNFDGADYGNFVFATQPFLKVSKEGRRITNESSPYDFITHAAALNPDPAWYPIWDATWREDVTRFFTIGCSTLFLREGSNNRPPGLDGTEAKIEEFIEAGYIIKADTLEELADGLLLNDKAAFLDEVANYNRMYEQGFDDQFGKEPFRLSSLDTPPYYGVRIGGEPLATLDGIRVTPDFQALDTEGVPIEGLYVIGNDSGGFYARTYPNQSAGLNAGRCVTAGMLCGQNLARM